MKLSPKRVVSHGFLLYEYIPDDNRYILVGVIDRALGGHGVDPETGEATDEAEAKEFFEKGKVSVPAMFTGDKS